MKKDKKTLNTDSKPQADGTNSKDNMDRPNRGNAGLVTIEIPFNLATSVAVEELKARGTRIEEEDGVIRLGFSRRPDAATEVYLRIFCACAHKLGYSTKGEILKQNEVQSVR